MGLPLGNVIFPFLLGSSSPKILCWPAYRIGWMVAAQGWFWKRLSCQTDIKRSLYRLSSFLARAGGFFGQIPAHDMGPTRRTMSNRSGALYGKINVTPFPMYDSMNTSLKGKNFLPSPPSGRRLNYQYGLPCRNVNTAGLPFVIWAPRGYKGK